MLSLAAALAVTVLSAPVDESRRDVRHGVFRTDTIVRVSEGNEGEFIDAREDVMQLVAEACHARGYEQSEFFRVGSDDLLAYDLQGSKFPQRQFAMYRCLDESE